MNVEFWFEFGSTYSYPAAMRIQTLAAELDVRVSWRVFLLGPIFQDQGWNDSPFNLFPRKGRYMWRDLERICAARDIPFRRPSEFPRNGLLAARIACRFADKPWLPDFVRGVYRANFAQDLDISTSEVIASCLTCSGEDPDALIIESQSPRSKEALRRQTEQASQLGIFGAPSFVVGREVFWGGDRLEDALNWAVEADSPLSSDYFTYIWEYTVDPARRAEFVSAYRPGGDWAQLMSRHAGYRGTKLLHDVETENRFVTIDYWVSRSDRDAFREEFASEFNRLDQECEQFTISESFIGDFAVLSD
jgi:2-hydroxychromene-2-carboxylate isomerase/heme-degrading monooxygenase HmoA